MKFTPSIFFPSGHMQTIVLPFLTIREYGKQHLWNYAYDREMLKLSDNGQIALDWVVPRNPLKASRNNEDSKSDRPILAVVPGLTGHNDDLYIVSTCLAAVENDYQLVMINHRGWSNSKLTTPQFYSAGDTNDLEQAVEHISSTYKDRDLFLVGFSIGANILANYLGKLGERAQVKAAMCIGNPYDLLKVSEQLNDKLWGLYNKAFTKNLVRKYNQHIETLRPLEDKLKIDLDIALRDMQTVRQLDNLITWRQYGFESVEEYYDKSSCIHQLKNIKVPTLFLNALDDPIFDKIAIPYQEFLQNDNIMLATTHGGGHIGYLKGIMKIEQWFTEPLFEFLKYFSQ